MLLTKASEYALLSLIYIAQKDAPSDVDTMSGELEISKSFLAKILQNLAREGILISFKGANGGFMLAQKPGDISIKRVIESAEKRKMAVFECSISQEGCSSSKNRMCLLFESGEKIEFINCPSEIYEVLGTFTPEDYRTLKILFLPYILFLQEKVQMQTAFLQRYLPKHQNAPSDFSLGFHTEDTAAWYKAPS